MILCNTAARGGVLSSLYQTWGRGAQQASSEVEANLRGPLCAFKALTDVRSRYFPRLDFRLSPHKMKLTYYGVPM